jgi:CheY-like chemotaxis protein
MNANRIMVVDDEAPIRELFVREFSRAGYFVDTAESAEEVMALLPQTACRVFFLDLYLPEMNGIDLCRRIRQARPQTICYAVTGYDVLYDLDEFRQADFEDCFIKPVSLAELVAAARNAFAKIEGR